MASLLDYLGKHAGETAYVIGKGPGLDVAHKRGWEGVGDLRICINETALLVPKPRFAVVADMVPVRAVTEKHPCETLVLNHGVRFAATIPDITASMTADLGLLAEMPADVAKAGELYGCGGTILPAIHFAWMMGVRNLVLVGCEGRGGYAKVWGAQASHDDSWMKIRRRQRTLCGILGMMWSDYK